jgi:xanthine dehydrogenase/oxidase
LLSSAKKLLLKIDPLVNVITSVNDAITNSPSQVQLFPEFCQKSTQIGSNSEHKIKGRFEIGSQFHFSMEPQSCVVVPVEDGLDVYSSTQWMDATQIAVAEALNLPNNVVNMNVRRLGGGFGGKISRPALLACAAAVAAHHLNRPIRLIMTIEANMNIVGKRYACINDYEIEIDDDGKIQKLVNDYTEDYGCSFNEPAYLTTGFFSNCYESQTFDVIARKTRTDTASNTWCRGPGTVEGISMIENIMEHIAWKVKKDPVEVRLNNIAGDSEMKKLLTEFVKSVGIFSD